MGLNRMNNDSALETGTQRTRLETFDKSQI